MGTNFNFKSQLCTSREQSERLLKLGLKKETADMFWTKPFKEWIAIVGKGYTDEDNIPAWSLHRLLCMLDTKDDDMYQAIVDVITRSIELGYFNKEYLI